MNDYLEMTDSLQDELDEDVELTVEAKEKWIEFRLQRGLLALGLIISYEALDNCKDPLLLMRVQVLKRQEELFEIDTSRYRR